MLREKPSSLAELLEGLAPWPDDSALPPELPPQEWDFQDLQWAARYLRDSDICVYALSGRHPKLVRAIDRRLPGQIAISVIALGELLIGAELERTGRPIGPTDLWIAAHARADQLILVTNNEREFKRVPGLKVVNWAI